MLKVNFSCSVVYKTGSAFLQSVLCEVKMCEPTQTRLKVLHLMTDKGVLVPSKSVHTEGLIFLTNYHIEMVASILLHY